MSDPTLTDLRDTFVQLEEHYKTLRAQWEEDLTYYEGDFTLLLPTGVEKTIPATGRNAVDIPATHIVTDQPTIKRNREVHEGVHFEKDDEAVEQYLLAILQANDQAAVTPPLHEAAKFQFLRGLGVLHGPFFNEEKHKKRDDDAIWYDVLDPANVLIEPGPKPSQGFVYQLKTVGEMLFLSQTDPRFADFDRGSRRSTDLLTLVEWYGLQEEGQDCLYAAWETPFSSGPSSGESFPTAQGAMPLQWLVEPFEARYPYLPLDIVFSGYGRRSPALEKLAQSIYTSQVKDLLRGESYALSVANNHMGNTAYERYRAPTQEALNRMVISYAAGTGSVIPSEVEAIKTNPIPDAVLQNYGNFQAALDTALFSGVVGGQRPKGVDTATGLAILSGQARLKFGPPLRFLEGGVARLLEKVGRLIEYNESKGEFHCMGRKITARQFHGDYRVKVTLYSEAPEERSAAIATGLSLLNNEKGPSEKYIFEHYFRIENYEEEKLQKAFEKIINSDEFMQAQTQYLSLAQGPPEAPGGNGQGGVEALAQIEGQAALFRAGRPGGLPQQEPLPGSPEMMAAQAGQMAQAGQPLMEGAPS